MAPEYWISFPILDLALLNQIHLSCGLFLLLPTIAPGCGLSGCGLSGCGLWLATVKTRALWQHLWLAG
jgi:hypothetical protein